MGRDRLFEHTASRTSDFEFDERVAAVFDDMLLRSIPLYLEQQSMIAEIAARFWTPDSRVYDLGCSTGTMLVTLARTLGPGARLVGYDNATPMLERAARKVAESGCADRIELRFADLNVIPAVLDLSGASVVAMCWTLQFVRPLSRDQLVRHLYDSLRPGGVLLVTEKVLTSTSHMNRLFVELYYEFKRRNAYTDQEITRKREALENVLVPYRIEENIELFRRNGFSIVETFFQWYNFAGFLCVKGLC